MSWLVLLHLKAPSQLSCLERSPSMLPETRSDELTHTNGYTDFQNTRVRLGPLLHSQNLFRQHLNPWLSAWLSMCDVASADLGPYLCLQLRSHSFLYRHLICHHCQSEHIRVSAAESERPPSSLCPWQPVCLLVCHQPSDLDSPTSPRLIGNENKCCEFALSWLDCLSDWNTLIMCPYVLSKRVNKYYIFNQFPLNKWDNSVRQQ